MIGGSSGGSSGSIGDENSNYSNLQMSKLHRSLITHSSIIHYWKSTQFVFQQLCSMWILLKQQRSYSNIRSIEACTAAVLTRNRFDKPDRRFIDLYAGRDGPCHSLPQKIQRGSIWMRCVRSSRLTLQLLLREPPVRHWPIAPQADAQRSSISELRIGERTHEDSTTSTQQHDISNQ